MTFQYGWWRRRNLIASAASLVGLITTGALAKTIKGLMPWEPHASSPPRQVLPGPWTFFTTDEGAAIEALVDGIIPPDPQTPGGKDAGCAVFIDRQLAGYMNFAPGCFAREQGCRDRRRPGRRRDAGVRLETLGPTGSRRGHICQERVG
jgi:gluconate 2-dehydrogenase gamma chain